jgi:hypothetical protein
VNTLRSDLHFYNATYIQRFSKKVFAKNRKIFDEIDEKNRRDVPPERVYQGFHATHN